MFRLLPFLSRVPFTGERLQQYKANRKFSLLLGFLLAAGVLLGIQSDRDSTARTVAIMLIVVMTLAGAAQFVYQIVRGTTYYQLLWRERAIAKKRSNANANEVEHYLAQQNVKAAK